MAVLKALVLGTLMMAPGAAAFAQPATPAVQQAVTPVAGDDFVLGVGDTIEVSVLGRSDFNTRARIGSDGKVLLPYIGAVPAAEKGAGQLAEEIRAALQRGDFFSQPSVRVDVVAVTSRYVTVLGSVGTPGLLPLDRQYRLSEILARVGGRADGGSDHLVLTRKDGQSQQYSLADLATGAGDKDPLVMSGDKIYIPAAENDVFYDVGQVRSPGAFPITPGKSLRLAIARAGGVGENGSEKKVKINRKGKEIKPTSLDATTVEPGDVITVGERLF
jgi:polysaccharide export outer membrane protein